MRGWKQGRENRIRWLLKEIDESPWLFNRVQYILRETVAGAVGG